MENGESVVTSGTGKKALSLSKTVLNGSTLKTFLKNSGQWAQNIMKLIVLFATRATLISCAGFKLLFTIAEKLVCKCNRCSLFALISLSPVWFAPRHPGMCPSEFWDF